jgi:hypothetical protein
MARHNGGGGGLLSHLIAFGLGIGSVAALGFVAFKLLKPSSIDVDFGGKEYDQYYAGDENESQGFLGLQNASGTQGYDVDTTGYKRVYDFATYPLLFAAADSGAYLMPYAKGQELPNPYSYANPAFFYNPAAPN